MEQTGGDEAGCPGGRLYEALVSGQQSQPREALVDGGHGNSVPCPQLSPRVAGTPCVGPIGLALCL